jgi:hypothetical protein
MDEPNLKFAYKCLYFNQKWVNDTMNSSCLNTTCTCASYHFSSFGIGYDRKYDEYPVDNT